MVLKAIINAVGKGAPKPKKFPPGSEFSKTDTDTLLQDSQKKIEKIEANEIKPIDTSKLIQNSDQLVIPGSKVAPNLTPQKIINKKVQATKSSKQKVD